LGYFPGCLGNGGANAHRVCVFSHKTFRKLTMVACLGLASTISTQAMALASAELYNTEANFYGRFEARIRFAPGDGVISSFFLWKEGSEVSGAFWNELDFEKVGADCHLQTNNIYGKPQVNHDTKPQVSGLCTDYHDFRFEWTPTYIAWLIDGKEVRRDTGEAATAYSQNATAGMTFHFNIWPGNQDFGGNINNTTLPVREYISWVQYSSYNNGTFELKWREEFQGPELPEGWVAGDWESPFKESTHSPKNVSLVNGIVVLAITADNATGNPGTPPVDPKAGGSGGNGGTTGSGGSGGQTSQGGSTSSSKGGSSASGGSSSAGGSASVGGSSASGGNSVVGGTTTTGGRGGTNTSVSASGPGGAGQGGSGSVSTGTSSSAGASDSGGQSASSSSNGGSSTSSSSSSSSAGASGGASSSASSAQGGSSSNPKSASSAGSSSSSGGSKSSSSASSGSASDSSSSGCGCRLTESHHPAPPLVLLSLAVVTLLVRIRRKGV
jgi:MYXO-CTERM domain-containing protein